MPGRRQLKLEHQVLRALSEGPQNKVTLRRALGLDPVHPAPHLDRLLQDMRIAGLVESAGGGIWRVKEGLEICTSCQGRGVKTA